MPSGNLRMSNGRPAGPALTANGSLSAFLSSLQVTDSFFPSGLFTLSHGIESFAQAGLLTPQSLASIVADLIRSSVGPSDAAGLAIAMRAAADNDLSTVARVDQRLTAIKITREPRETSIRLGRQLLALSRDADIRKLATSRGRMRLPQAATEFLHDGHAAGRVFERRHRRQEHRRQRAGDEVREVDHADALQRQRRARGARTVRRELVGQGAQHVSTARPFRRD